MLAEEKKNWFYLDQSNQQQGPYAFPELKALVNEGLVRDDTLIWNLDDGNKFPASELTGLIPNSEDHLTPPQKAETPVSGTSATPPPLSQATSSKPPLPSSVQSVANETPATKLDPLPHEELKPRKGSFLFSRIVVGLLSSILLGAAAAGACAIYDLSPWIGLAVFAFLFVVFVYLAFVAFGKERYELTEGNVLCHKGSLISDQTTDVDICNITHVEMTLPWLRFKLLGIGTIKIHSAGNAQPIIFRTITKPQEIYEQLQERLKRNGYQLQQKELLHEEKPAFIGALLHLGRMALGIFIALFFAFSALVAEKSDDLESIALEGIITAIGGAFLLSSVLFFLVSLIGILKRTYRVYEDVVTYEEGFLTRVKAFIPYENISDASTNRSFLDKVLNLYEVVISCQGSSKEIKFQFLKDGVYLTQCIQQLITEANLKPSPSEQMQASEDGPSFTTRKEPELPRLENVWMADLKMHWARVFLPLFLLIPVVPLFIVAMIQVGIKFFATSYSVSNAFIGHSFRFLNTVDREFAYDKITGLVIKQNLFDRIFGTFTLRFWSIGSKQSLELAHVHRSQVDLEALLRQIGIPTEYEHTRIIPTKFSPFSWIRANCYNLLVALLVAIGAAAFAIYSEEDLVFAISGIALLLPFIVLIRSWIFYSKQEVSLHDHHMEASQGVIAKRTYFTRYRSIKKTLTTVYPGGKNGSLKVFVAGEQTLSRQKQQTEKQSQYAATIPCSFTLGFLPEVLKGSQLLDDVLAGRLEVQDESTELEPLELITESKRGIGNSLVSLTFWSIIIFPLLPFLLITFPLTLLSTKRWRYRLEAGRIVSSWGLLFKKRESILLDRVDSQQQTQGLLGKIFRNGTVKIMTAGSSKPDLIISDAASYQTISQKIKSITKKG